MTLLDCSLLNRGGKLGFSRADRMKINAHIEAGASCFRKDNFIVDEGSYPRLEESWEKNLKRQVATGKQVIILSKGPRRG